MTDSLFSDKDKKEIINLIKQQNFDKIIKKLQKIKTSHAGTAKTKDKRFVLTETVKHIRENSGDPAKTFFETGKELCNRNEDVAKELGISLIWRGYSYNKDEVCKLLIKIADDENWEVREYAGSAFANTLHDNPDFYDELKKLYRHPSENVRRAIVISAIGLRDKSDKKKLKKAFALLQPLLFDKSGYVRKNLGPFVLGSYFGNTFPKETLAQLKKWTEIGDDYVRWNIAMAFNNSFGNKYPEEALKILKLLIGDVSLVVKRAVVSTLRFLRKKHEKIVDQFVLQYEPDLIKKYF
jgi:vesicle coat complex subunit